MQTFMLYLTLNTHSFLFVCIIGVFVSLVAIGFSLNESDMNNIHGQRDFCRKLFKMGCVGFVIFLLLIAIIPRPSAAIQLYKLKYPDAIVTINGVEK